jgi:hypothetical protein
MTWNANLQERRHVSLKSWTSLIKDYNVLRPSLKITQSFDNLDQQAR